MYIKLKTYMRAIIISFIATCSIILVESLNATTATETRITDEIRIKLEYPIHAVLKTSNLQNPIYKRVTSNSFATD